MATDVSRVNRVESGPRTETLLLIWQHPDTRRFHRVAKLSRSDDGGYVFEYVPEAWDVDGFEPLLQFPRTDGPSRYESLPPFFQNRVLSTERENYAEYLHWIGLEPNSANLPMEFLARTGGSRVTDTFHVVQEPPIDDGLFGRFFVSGVRHVDPDGLLVGQLNVGDELRLDIDPDYDREPPAMWIVTPEGDSLGYVPDWLVDEVHRLRDQGKNLVVKLEQINPDAPFHLRLLCRIEIQGS